MDTPERKLIRSVMKDGQWYTPREIAELTGLGPVNNVNHLLRKMERAGQVWRPRTGKYVIVALQS